MPKFADIPIALNIPSKFLTFEDAFHKLGNARYNDWDSERVLQHDKQLRSEGLSSQVSSGVHHLALFLREEGELDDESVPEPSTALIDDVRRNAQRYNLWVNRYETVIELLINLLRDDIQASAINFDGKVITISNDNWNGVLARKTVEYGLVNVADGFFCKPQSEDARPYILLVRKHDIENFINDRPLHQVADTRELEDELRAFFKAFIADNFDTPIPRKECMDRFWSERGGRGTDTLSKAKIERAWKEVCTDLDASAWMARGRRPKNNFPK